MSVTILYHVFNWSKFVCWTSANMFQIFRILWGSYIFWVKTWRFDCIGTTVVLKCFGTVFRQSVVLTIRQNNLLELYDLEQIVAVLIQLFPNFKRWSSLISFCKLFDSCLLGTEWRNSGLRTSRCFFLTVLCVFALHFTFNKNTNLPIEIIIIV